MSRAFPSRLLAGCFLVLVAAGCNSKPAIKFTPVEGRVTLDGKALAGVYVQFIPDNSLGQVPGSMALTDADGKFVLKTSEGQPGAVVGKHNVTIRGERADDRSNTAATGVGLPATYSQVGPTNPLGQTDVTADKAVYDFPLKSR